MHLNIMRLEMNKDIHHKTVISIIYEHSGTAKKTIFCAVGDIKNRIKTHPCGYHSITVK